MINEVEAFESFASTLGTSVRSKVLAEVEFSGQRYPIRSMVFGSEDPESPVLAIFGGVHGLEKIGSEVALAYLNSFSEYAAWDQSTQAMLKHARVAFVPLVNPVGVIHATRSNGNGVDIMRNAPIDSPEPALRSLIFRGHRISPSLPWYRGREGAPMETETQALVDFVREEIFGSKLGICVDVHSGFGAIDRLWFPYAGKRDLIPDVGDALGLKQLLDRTLPNHVYVVEPQSRQYTTHGDVWDYLYEMFRRENSGQERLFLPLTLEMGSWNWLKKNPFHAFSAAALFHPIKAHRIRRVLRRHSGLFDFLFRAVQNGDGWRCVADSGLQARRKVEARGLWSE